MPRKAKEEINEIKEKSIKKEPKSKKATAKKATTKVTTAKKITAKKAPAKKDVSETKAKTKVKVKAETKKSTSKKTPSKKLEKVVKKANKVKTTAEATKKETEVKTTTKTTKKETSGKTPSNSKKKTTAEKKSTIKKSSATKEISLKEEVVKPKKTTTKKTTSTKKTSTKKVEPKNSKTKNTKTKTTTTKKAVASKKEPVKKKQTKKKVEIVEYYDLPYRYNQTIVKVLAQTPNTLFVYWDISDDDRKKYVEQYGEYFFNNTKPVLIVHNKTKNYNFEVDINDFANSWYLRLVDSDCDYQIELGRRPINKYVHISNNYLYVTNSNEIESPNDHILFDKLSHFVYFKNVKTNETIKKHTNLTLLSKIGKISSVQEFYKKLYPDEAINFDRLNLNNPTSSFK